MSRYHKIYVGFMVVFVSFVLLTNTVGTKLFTIWGQTLPVSILWYPLTFLITDIVSELYGPKRARFLVVMGFSMSLLLLVFSLVGIALPSPDFYKLDKDYKNIFGPVWRLLFGSMAAYLLAQFIDVHIFHWLKRKSDGKYLWLRNNGSTMISQFVDSFTVNFIFLYGNKTVLSVKDGESEFLVVLGIVLMSYMAKVIIAVLDTPFCYLGIRLVEKYTGIKGGNIT